MNMKETLVPILVWRLFYAHWRGTDDQLHEVLDQFYGDIRGSFELTGVTEGQLGTVDDYYSNHYGE